jgi:hypothetical protein
MLSPIASKLLLPGSIFLSSIVSGKQNIDADILSR